MCGYEGGFDSGMDSGMDSGIDSGFDSSMDMGSESIDVGDTMDSVDSGWDSLSEMADTSDTTWDDVADMAEPSETTWDDVAAMAETSDTTWDDVADMAEPSTSDTSWDDLSDVPFAGEQLEDTSMDITDEVEPNEVDFAMDSAEVPDLQFEDEVALETAEVFNEPEIVEPEPEVVEPEVVEPEVIEPEVVEPEPEVVEPETSEVFEEATPEFTDAAPEVEPEVAPEMAEEVYGEQTEFVEPEPEITEPSSEVGSETDGSYETGSGILDTFETESTSFETGPENLDYHDENQISGTNDVTDDVTDDTTDLNDDVTSDITDDVVSDVQDTTDDAVLMEEDVTYDIPHEDATDEPQIMEEDTTYDIPHDEVEAEATDVTSDVQDTTDEPQIMEEDTTYDIPHDEVAPEVTENVSEVAEETEPIDHETAMNNMAEYLTGHNYGLEDYGTYSQDPEWQALNRDLQISDGIDPDNVNELAEVPSDITEPIGHDVAMNNMAEYLSSHNYGREDFATYSRDPEWQRLNNDLQIADGIEPTDYSQMEREPVDHDTALSNMNEYLSSHNYGLQHQDIYMNDPEWQRLNNDLQIANGIEPTDYSTADIPPVSYEHAYDRMYDYITEHNYGQGDYDTYSKDPEWQRLNNDLQIASGYEPTDYSAINEAETTSGSLDSASVSSADNALEQFDLTTDDVNEINDVSEINEATDVNSEADSMDVASIMEDVEPENIPEFDEETNIPEVMENPEVVEPVSQQEAYDNMYQYITEHNYGLDDYDTYSQDPEWQALNRDLQISEGINPDEVLESVEIPEAEVPEVTDVPSVEANEIPETAESVENIETPEPVSQQEAYDNMYQYITEHNYGREDYETYSQDPEWQRLNHDLQVAEGINPDETLNEIAIPEAGEEIAEQYIREYSDFEQAIEDEIPGFYDSGEFYEQGVNSYGFNGTCGPTSGANALNQLFDTNEFSEEKVLDIAVNNNLCETGSLDPNSNGGTTTEQLMEVYEKINEATGNKFVAESFDYDNCLSAEQVAERLDSGSVVNVAVDANRLWDIDDGADGFFGIQDSEFYTDHWITLKDTVYDDAGNLTGFEVIDSGGGVNEVSLDKYNEMCFGTEGHKAIDPTCIVLSRNEGVNPGPGSIKLGR